MSTSARSAITTHVLDTSLGRPAAGIDVRLERLDGPGGEAFVEIAAGTTDADGRVSDLLEPGPVAEATYRITFELDAYFAATGRESFYPRAQIAFVVRASGEHYHVPLLLSPFGYSTYRGS